MSHAVLDHLRKHAATVFHRDQEVGTMLLEAEDKVLSAESMAAIMDLENIPALQAASGLDHLGPMLYPQRCKDPSRSQ